jgi:hypothetical protein
MEAGKKVAMERTLFNTAASTATDDFQSNLRLQLFAIETNLKVTKTQNVCVRNGKENTAV